MTLNLGEAIKKAREERGLSQEAAAKEIEKLYPGVRISGPYLSMIENGTKTNLTVNLIDALISYFKISHNVNIGDPKAPALSLTPLTPDKLIKDGFSVFTGGSSKLIGNNMYEVNFGDFLPIDLLELLQKIRQLNPEQRKVIEMMTNQLLIKHDEQK